MKLFNNNDIAEIYGIEDLLKPETKNIIKPIDETFTETPINSKVYYKNMDELQAEVSKCNKCRLSITRSNIVFGSGSVTAKLFFVGEGPGAEEDKMGLPFVGRSGQLLTKMIEAMGLKRSEVYIANIVKCRPPDNRNPFDDEADCCIGYLKSQIDIIKPDYLICLGSVAVKHLLKVETSITKLRGTWQEFHGYKVMPTFHPSYLLRSPSKKAEAWLDLQEVMKVMGLSLA